MSDVSQRAGSRWPLAASLAAAAIAAAGCLAPLPPPSATVGPSPPPTPPVGRSPGPATASAGPPTATPGSSPDGGATPIPDLAPANLPLTTFTIVCEDWGGQTPPSTIDCADAVALALAAIGGEPAGAIRRLDFRFGDGCDRGGPCAERRPDVGWVVARYATRETRGVRVALAESGELRAWPPLPGPPDAQPTFTPPAATTPDIGELPPSLRGRSPAAFCGAEDLTTLDAFDTTARACFLGGVLAGVPVELVSRSMATEGGAVLTLYRFGGRGAVLRYVRAGTGWAGSACGISPLGTSAVFILAGTCDRLVP